MDITNNVLSKLSNQIGGLTFQLALKDSLIEALQVENAELKAKLAAGEVEKTKE